MGASIRGKVRALASDAALPLPVGLRALSAGVEELSFGLVQVPDGGGVLGVRLQHVAAAVSEG